MAQGALDRQIDEYLQSLGPNYTPDWRFAWNDNGDPSQSQLYVMPRAFADDYQRDSGSAITGQDMYTGRFSEVQPISEADALSDPRYARDYEVFKKLQEFGQMRRDPFSPFGDQFSMALGALAASTGLAGAYGAFSPAVAAGAEAGAAAGAGAGAGEAAAAGGYAGLGSLGPEALTVYGGAEGLALGGPSAAGGLSGTLGQIAPYAQWGGRGLNLIGKLTGNKALQQAGGALSTAGGGAGNMANWTGSLGDWLGLAGTAAGAVAPAVAATIGGGGGAGQSPIGADILPNYANTSILSKDAAISSAMSAWELANQRRQVGQDTLAPFMEQLGYSVQRDDSGRVIGVTDQGTPEQQGLARVAQEYYQNQARQGVLGADWQVHGLNQLGMNEAASQAAMARGDQAAADTYGAAQGQYAYTQALQEAARQGLDSPQGRFALEGLQREAAVADQLQTPALERMGVRWTANGPVNVADSPEMLNRQLQADLLRRAQAAAGGKGEVDPGLMRQLQEEEAAIQNRMRASLGADWASSTPGMAAQADFAKRRSEALYNQRQNDMSRGIQNANALQGSNLATLGQLYGVTDAAARNYGLANQAQSQRVADYSNVSNMGQNAARTLQAAGGQFGQNAATRAGMSNAYGAGADRLVNMPQQQMQNMAGTLSSLYNASANLRGARMNAGQQLVQNAYADPGYGNMAQIFGNIGAQYGNLARGLGADIQQGNLAAYKTDPTNRIWEGAANSAGQVLGSVGKTGADNLSKLLFG